MNDKAVRTYRQLAKVHAFQQDAASYEATLSDAINATDSVEMKFDLATFYFGQQKYQQSAISMRKLLLRILTGRLQQKITFL